MKNFLILINLALLLSLKSNGQGFPCNPNTFWGISGGQISEWTISGTTITSNGVLSIPQATGNALGFCDNLSGGTFSPTFYSSDLNTVSYYDGTNWVPTGVAQICSVSNAAGAGNYLYYNVYGGSCIDRFDGNSMTTIYSNPGRVFSIADLTADAAGNIWCPMGYIAGTTDSIIVISPSGQVLHQFSLPLSSNNGYGAFLLNGILYLGFGSSNSTYPNKLVPITFTSTTAVAGLPINFTTTSLDLASCNPGMPLIVPDADNPLHELNVYPSIANDFLNIVLHVKSNTNLSITIMNALGEIFYHNPEIAANYSFETKIDISRLAKGIYFLSADNGKEKIVKKFVKQ
jgi:hypothetical protein